MGNHVHFWKQYIQLQNVTQYNIEQSLQNLLTSVVMPNRLQFCQMELHQ